MLVKLDSIRNGARNPRWVNPDNIIYLEKYAENETMIYFNTNRGDKLAFLIVYYQCDVVAELLNNVSSKKMK